MCLMSFHILISGLPWPSMVEASGSYFLFWYGFLSSLGLSPYTANLVTGFGIFFGIALLIFSFAWFMFVWILPTLLKKDDEEDTK